MDATVLRPRCIRCPSNRTPKRFQTGLAFWASKTLLSAIEIGLFTELAPGPESRDAVTGRLGRHPRSARDFLDGLVALGFLHRDGDRYANTAETNLILDRNQPSYVGGILEMANHRLYPFWSHLTEALRTGGSGLFETLYADPALPPGHRHYIAPEGSDPWETMPAPSIGRNHSAKKSPIASVTGSVF